MQAEDLISDETFVAWFFKTDAMHEQRWNLWIAAHPEMQPVVDQAVLLLESLSANPEDHLHEHTLNERNRLMDAVNAWENNNKVIKPVFSRSRVLWLAASVSLLLVSLFLFLNKPFGTQEYATTQGQIRKFELPDGSEITLNGNSQLRLGKQWNSHGTREVWLDGEAFFHVRHTTTHQRFLVHSGELTVEVLGTTFNVKNRRAGTEVVLASGKISLHTANETQPVLMHPGERVAYSAGKRIVPEKVVAEEFTSWQSADIVFEDASLMDVARILENAFGLEVHVAPEVSTDRQFNGTFDRKDVGVILTALARTYDLDITRDTRTITIRNKTHHDEK